VSASLGPATASRGFPTEREPFWAQRLVLPRGEHCVKVVDVDYGADNLTYRIDHALRRPFVYVDYTRCPTSHKATMR
jgi:hypothetical protein